MDTPDEHKAEVAPWTPIRFRQTTTDLDLAREEMSRFWPDGRADFSGRHHFYSRIEALVLGASSYGANATRAGLEVSRLYLDRCMLLSIPINGFSSHRFCGKVHRAGGGTAVFHPSNEEIACTTSTDLETLQVTIHAGVYESYVREYVGLDHVGKAALQPEVRVSGECGKSIAALSRRMIRMITEPDFDPLDSSLGLMLFEKYFLRSIVESQAQGWSFLDHCPVAEPFYVAMAEEYTRYHLMDPIGLKELAAVCGVSGRSLQLGFRKYRGYCPTEFGRNLRLEAARTDLRFSTGLLGVTEIAMKWGFSHLGRFSGDYRRKFGESPSHTLRKYGRS